MKEDAHVMTEMGHIPNPKEPPFRKKKGNLQNCVESWLDERGHSLVR